jgi:uncharacterized membrane protein YdjX (TVP38/TMEM64 family)
MKRIKKHARDYKNILIYVVVTALFNAVYFYYIRTPSFQHFVLVSQEYYLQIFIGLVVVKILAILYPPIPGALFSFGLIPVLGWKGSYLADSIGGMTGSMCAYMIGRFMGKNFLLKIIDKNIFTRLEKMKIKKHKRVEAVSVLKIFYGSISEYISYCAHLLGVNFRSFLLGTFIATLANIPFFIFADNLIHWRGFYFNVVFGTVAILAFVKLKGRYFE